MSKYFIDRNQAVNALNEAQIEGTDTHKGLGLAKQIIDELPCECRPTGEWKRKVHYLDICWECSNCGHNSNYYSPLYNFCPDCGADMRGKAE